MRITPYIQIVIQLICVSSQVERPTNIAQNDIKVVFALAGLRLREQPNLYSKNQVTIPYGSELEILNKIDGKIKIDYFTSGEWVEVKWQGKKGYVFDGYLLNKKEFNRFNKAYRYLQARSLDKKKNQRYKYFLKYEPNMKGIPSSIFYLEKKSNSNFTVYTFMPEKYKLRAKFGLKSRSRADEDSINVAFHYLLEPYQKKIRGCIPNEV